MASHQTFSGQIKHMSGQIKFGQTYFLSIINGNFMEFAKENECLGQFSVLIISTETILWTLSVTSHTFTANLRIMWPSSLALGTPYGTCSKTFQLTGHVASCIKSMIKPTIQGITHLNNCWFHYSNQLSIGHTDLQCIPYHNHMFLYHLFCQHP